MLNDESEIRSIIKTSDKLAESLTIGKEKLIEKITIYKNSNIAYPFNLLCDYILLHNEIYVLEKEKEHMNTQKDKVIKY